MNMLDKYKIECSIVMVALYIFEIDQKKILEVVFLHCHHVNVYQ